MRKQNTPAPLGSQDTLALTFNQKTYLTGSIFGAGSDTTASTISVDVLATTCLPDGARNIWKELESVIGVGRAPTLSVMFR
jgi:hypothetical protein